MPISRKMIIDLLKSMDNEITDLAHYDFDALGDIDAVDDLEGHIESIRTVLADTVALATAALAKLECWEASTGEPPRMSQ